MEQQNLTLIEYLLEYYMDVPLQSVEMKYNFFSLILIYFNLIMIPGLLIHHQNNRQNMTLVLVELVDAHIVELVFVGKLHAVEWVLGWLYDRLNMWAVLVFVCCIVVEHSLWRKSECVIVEN